MRELFGLRSVLRSWVKPARDAAYRRWIKSLPCLACGRNWNVDPCAISQKASDYTCIPLCRDCHRAYDRAPYDFQAVKGWDMAELLGFFWHLYELKTGRKVGDRPAEERRAA